MEPALIEAIERILTPFVEEALPQGGINTAASRWQRPGRGYGGDASGRPDVRYVAALVEVLYEFGRLSGRADYRQLADRQVRFIASFAAAEDPTWLWGTALQAIGAHRRYNGPDSELAEAARKIRGWAESRKVPVQIGPLTYSHFPCGYGLFEAKDAGWTNDLSIFGCGLLDGFECTGDDRFLEEAASFAEFFLQPWKPDALGTDGYWHAGTWREDMGTWVIGPLRYNGAESTNGNTDENSWLFSTYPCIDYFTRLYRHRPDPRLLERSVRGAEWAFDACQFSDGAVGLCGRDDKWLGCTGFAVSQVCALAGIMVEDHPEIKSLLGRAANSYRYLQARVIQAELEGNGVDWVNRSTLADPMVNVGWLWLGALKGILDGAQRF